MSCGVGCRHSWDPALLWLWRRQAPTAPIRPLAWEPTAPIRLLAWEPLYAADAALESKKIKKLKK